MILADITGDPAAGVGVLAALAAGIVSFLSPCVLPLVPGYLSAVTGVSANELEDADWRRVVGPSLIFVASFSSIFILLGLTATGLGSFLSPCVLPLVPGYLSAVTGVSANELEDADWRRVVGPSLIFVASFSSIFILLGLTATGLGSFLSSNKPLLTQISGWLIIAMGVLFVGSLFITRLNKEWHVDALLSRAGKGGPIVAGAAFAIAWTPCIGPTLGAILSAAAASGSAGRGAFLLAVYSAGLAIPFLATALAFSRMTTAFAVVKRHYQAIVAVGGLILIVMGILIVTGEFKQLNIEAQNWLSNLGLDFWNQV